MDNVFWIVLCPIVLMVTDYITGVIKAIAHKNVSSSAMRQGLAHKFAYCVVIFVAWFVEFESAHIDLGFTFPLFVPVVAAISLIEITSILENCVEINPELGNTKILSIFKGGENNEK